NFIEKRIAILGGSTTADIKDILEIFLLSEGIKPVFYESEYNRFNEDAFFGEELEKFIPDIIYIHISYRNISQFPHRSNSKEDVNSLLSQEYNKYCNIWNTLKEKFNCIIIQNNFEYPRNRIMGNFDRISPLGKINYIDKLNRKLVDYAEQTTDFYINDINYLSASIGLDKWHDLSMWYGYKYSLSFEAIPHLCKNIANIIKAIFGKNKKCIVLDLDNTLWGGVIGDDGINNLAIGTETAIGEAYTEFQKYIKELKNIGISLAIASKNEESIAREGLNLSDMILKEKDFYTIKANWVPKFENIAEIAQEINIGKDSIIFLDDNPAEREIVKINIPDICVPNIGDNVVNYIDYIDKNGYFEITKLSKEDLERNDSYESNKKRNEEKKKFASYEDFLLSLDMIADINFIKPIYNDRIAQLTNKTNQFNLTTKRYSLSDIEQIAKLNDNVIIYGRLKDKFGDNGLISIVIGKIIDKDLHIDLWLMSCRALKRDMEKAMLDFLIDVCNKKKLDNIYGYYYKTSKNNMVREHYLNLGFECLEQSEESSKWKLSVKYINGRANEVIKIEEY
ncbi:MAG: HAD-IIIC family phosphatase, partial [Fusobacteriaceae bacterium]|nr:HAD-IIIC family phosphatase [Fusobacteriaceae bacterium]